jgi:hypothetical protein
MRLPGNALALAHVPHALVLTRINPALIKERIAQRADESKGIFEDVEFLHRVAECFEAPWFRDIFESRGTKIYELCTEGSLEETSENAKRLIEQLLSETS